MDDLLALHPSLETGKIEVDYGGGIERKDLAQGETTYHGIARRLVVPGNECFQLGGGVAKEIDGGTKGLSCQGRAM
jgi:hypothetical protein